MQNRRIINQIFHEVGIDPRPRIETNSFSSIWAHVRSGPWASIVPHTYVHAFGRVTEIRAIPLVDPVRSQAIGLVVSDRDPLPPVAAALLRCARTLDLEGEIARDPPRCRRLIVATYRSFLQIDLTERAEFEVSAAFPVAASGTLINSKTNRGGTEHGEDRLRALRRSGRRLPDDPIARDDLPKLERYPDGQTLPTPKAIDFQPGALLGSVSGELGLRKFLESGGPHARRDLRQGRRRIRRSTASCVDAEIVISQPFWPAYMTAERIAKAPKLKLAITAGIGSDHVDLQAAMDRGITVAEVTYCNSISVAEHVVMMILGAGAQLHPVLPVGGEGRLEHRRLRRALLRRRRACMSAPSPRGASASPCCGG